MVLESLITPQKAEKEWWELFFIGFLYASIAIFLSLWIFEQYASLVMVFLTVTASVPLMYNTMRYEEHEDIVCEKESQRMIDHAKILKIFSFIISWFCFSLYSILCFSTSKYN